MIVFRSIGRDKTRVSRVLTPTNNGGFANSIVNKLLQFNEVSIGDGTIFATVIESVVIYMVDSESAFRKLEDEFPGAVPLPLERIEDYKIAELIFATEVTPANVGETVKLAVEAYRTELLSGDLFDPDELGSAEGDSEKASGAEDNDFDLSALDALS